MIAVETFQLEQSVLNTFLHDLAREGVISIKGTDEEGMSETTWHSNLKHYLFTALSLFLQKWEDCLIAANLRILYDAKSPQKCYAPDVFVAFDVENRERSSYNLAHEKIMPQVVFEIASEQTVDKDAGEKYLLYAKLGVEEYYLLDPERNLMPESLTAFQAENGVLKPWRIENNRIFSPRLGLEIVDTSDNFRLFNPNSNEFLRSTEEVLESEIKLRQRIAELEARLNLNGKS